MKSISIKTRRRTLQIGIALVFIILPILNHYHYNFFYGNLLAFHAAGLPLADPLAVLQVSIMSPHPSFSLLIGAGIALLLAACLGTVFCSWACPFGLLSELVHGLSQRLRKGNRGFHPGLRGFTVKSVLFGLGLGGIIFFFDSPALNQVSMPGWYSRIFQMLAGQGYLSLAIYFMAGILFIEFMTRTRIWCTYICPQACLLVLSKIANPLHLKVEWNRNNCICGQENSPCQRSCSLSLDPKTLGNLPDTECNNCGDCVAVCTGMGKALKFRFFFNSRRSG